MRTTKRNSCRSRDTLAFRETPRLKRAAKSPRAYTDGLNVAGGTETNTLNKSWRTRHKNVTDDVMRGQCSAPPLDGAPRNEVCNHAKTAIATGMTTPHDRHATTLPAAEPALTHLLHGAVAVFDIVTTSGVLKSEDDVHVQRVHQTPPREPPMYMGGNSTSKKNGCGLLEFHQHVRIIFATQSWLRQAQKEPQCSQLLRFLDGEAHSKTRECTT